MKTFCMIIIYICFVVNTAIHSMAYEAWQSGVPMRHLLHAGFSVQAAIMDMPPRQLSEVTV